MKDSSGDFVWYEVITSDTDGAREFYSAVLGWEFSSLDLPDGRQYHTASVDGEAVAGMIALPGDEHGECMGEPGWLGYIAVDDVDRSVEEIKQAGGSVMVPAMEAPGVGRLSMVHDPQNVPFYVMHRSAEEASRAFDQSKTGHFNWHELMARNLEEALAFYQKHFGWQEDEVIPMGDRGSYHLFNNGEQAVGGMTRTMEDDRPGWTFYIGVGGIDAVAESVVDAGGSLLSPICEVPGGAFTVNAADPQGAVFGLVGRRD